MRDDGKLPCLFDAFAELAHTLPWQRLGQWPTPVSRLDRLVAGNLWIKRDDLSSPVYGGNKVRKLEFILPAARRRRSRLLITMGGIGSHHGLATAIFCRRLGLPCMLLLFRQPLTEEVKKNLLLMHAQGARLVYRRTLGRTVVSYFLGMRIKHPRACFVYAGGSNPVGTIGFVNAAFELKRQVDAGELPEPGAILCPFGSGGTLAGLALGVRLAGLASRVVGVRVTASRLGPFSAATEGTVRRLMERTLALLRRRAPSVSGVRLQAPSILHDYFGPGYGAATDEGGRAARLMQEKEGIGLEPTYTAKTVAAVLDFCKNRGTSEGPVLYWHTYNSADLGAQTAALNFRRLPADFHCFFEA
jgi:D-cysteine desulfhydrase